MDSISKVPDEILQMITGKLLGDGCITKQTGRSPRFQFIHSIKDKEWCFYCYENLKEYLPLTAPRYKKVIDHRILAGFTECYQVQSRTDPLITWLYTMWYPNRIKTIPFPLLDLHLNELSLAWWYQDDGHLSKVDNTPKKIILSTDNFSTNETQGLIKLLKRKFLFNFRLDSQNRLILYDQLQIFYFLRLIEPYILPSMNRKIILPNNINASISKRTSVYLPNEILLSNPTAEINKKLTVNLSKIIDIMKDRHTYIHFYQKIIVHSLNKNETKGFQIVIQESNNYKIQLIRNLTGLTISQIVTICFLEKWL